MKIAKRYWGWLVVALLVLTWSTARVGPIAPLVLSVLAAVYFLFQAPVICWAVNRNESQRCRNNAHGVLMGCHLSYHKWQKLKELVNPHRWHELNRAMWHGAKKCVTAAVALASIGSGVAAVATLAIDKL